MLQHANILIMNRPEHSRHPFGSYSNAFHTQLTSTHLWPHSFTVFRERL